MESLTNETILVRQTSTKIIGRRQLLQAIAATGGAVATSMILPQEWVKPVIEVGYLPAHAQTSPLAGDLVVTLTWNTGNPNASRCIDGGGAQGAVDLDIHVVEPDGTRVFFLNRTGPTARLENDNQKAFGPEIIVVPPGRATPGVYRVQMMYFCGAGVPTRATIDVTVFAPTPQQQSVTFTRDLPMPDDTLAVHIAEITFPAGTIQEVTGVTLLPAAQGATKS
jgi:hypothetical protein